MGWKAVLFFGAVSYVIETTSFFHWDCPKCRSDKFSGGGLQNLWNFLVMPRYGFYGTIVVLPSPIKEYNYRKRVSQTSLALTKFIVNSISIYVFK
jgi:hypothetical protein